MSGVTKKSGFALIVLFLFFVSVSFFSCSRNKPPSPDPTSTSTKAAEPTEKEKEKTDIEATGTQQKESEKDKTEDDKNVEKALRNLTQRNRDIAKCRANAYITRLHPDFLSDIFPPYSNPQYVNLNGEIFYNKFPYILKLSLAPRVGGEFYYQFSSPDGSNIKLKNTYVELPNLETPLEAPKFDMERKNEEDKAGGSLWRSSDIDDKGNVLLSPDNPLNLIFPYTFKTNVSSNRLTFLRKTKIGFTDCLLFEMQSGLEGKSRVYVTDDKFNDIYLVERINEKNEILSSASYRDPWVRRKGGRIPTKIEISVQGQPVLRAVFQDVLTNKGVVEETPASTPKPKKNRNLEILGGQPLLTTGLIAAVLILLTGLVFFAYRFWFYKADRPGFSKEVIIVEGDKPEEKISDLFTELGIGNTPFTPEKLTGERALLDFKTKKRPRVLVIGPGMSSKSKAYNFLIKGYVGDGGRVVIFEHGVENVADMPFTPTFMPFDRTDPDYTFVILPKWEKMWKMTTIEEIKKRTQAFLPYEIIIRIKEKNVIVDPIIVALNPDANITAAAICLIREGKGEYMVIQYRLIEAIRKLKFTGSVGEKMLRDIMEYMFGKEKKILVAPQWIMTALKIKPREDEDREEPPQIDKGA